MINNFIKHPQYNGKITINSNNKVSVMNFPKQIFCKGEINLSNKFENNMLFDNQNQDIIFKYNITNNNIVGVYDSISLNFDKISIESNFTQNDNNNLNNHNIQINNINLNFKANKFNNNNNQFDRTESPFIWTQDNENSISMCQLSEQENIIYPNTNASVFALEEILLNACNNLNIQFKNYNLFYFIKNIKFDNSNKNILNFTFVCEHDK